MTPTDYISNMLKESNLQIKTALDLGCGIGDNSMMLAKGGAKVLSIDRNPEMVKATRARALQENLPTLQAQVSSILDFRSIDHYDLLLFTNVLHFIPETKKEQALQNILSLDFSYLAFSDLIDSSPIPKKHLEPIKNALSSPISNDAWFLDKPHEGMPYSHNHHIQFVFGRKNKHGAPS